jgi:hypothetical protein
LLHNTAASSVCNQIIVVVAAKIFLALDKYSNGKG